MKRIKIISEQEIELSEREQKIYDAGHNDGFTKGGLIVFIGTIIIITLVAIFSK